ncbi:hypothetical protein [Ruminococcus sp.]|jgi:ABC-type thiamin/hydroxymethylpyrimidine transport system permease subunit|uniref:hypothetical protein n=1 Tax=Ruminococcus sp. TaxID=41978 RepID=UPI0025CEC503|nr:hypothetical protein [Ruminococcus sp.]
MNWSDIFLVSLNIIGLSIAFLTLLGVNKNKSKELTKMQQEAVKYSITWLRISIICKIFLLWFNINAIVTTVLIPFISNDGNLTRVYIYSAWSLFSTVCPLMINLKKYSLSFRKAYNTLNEVIHGSDEDILRAKKIGEQNITEGFDD